MVACVLGWLLVSLAGGCDDRAIGIDVDAGDRPDGSVVLRDGSVVPEDSSVEDGAVTVYEAFSHDGYQLFGVSLTDFSVRVVDWFSYNGGNGGAITDIAMDRAGRLWGITFEELYRIDTDTAACTYVGRVSAGVTCNGLAAVGPGAPGIDQNQLVAACESGLFVIDPVSMDMTFLASFQSGFQSSGDVVFVPGEGLYVTIWSSASNTDVLALFRLPVSGSVAVGEIGVREIYGLAYWNDRLFGFSQSGGIYEISLTSGGGTTLAMTEYSFWGATLAANQVRGL